MEKMLRFSCQIIVFTLNHNPVVLMLGPANRSPACVFKRRVCERRWSRAPHLSALSADGRRRSAAFRQETGSMATIMAGGGEKKTKKTHTKMNKILILDNIREVKL